MNEKNVREATRLSISNCHFQKIAIEKIKSEFDTIVMMNVLEHVKNPVSFLSNARRLLAEGGRIIIMVPNADSMNREIGRLIGAIKTNNELETSQIVLYGHRRVYNDKTLERDIKRAKLRIIVRSRAMVKPFTCDQMESLMHRYGKEWMAKVIGALAVFGKKIPMKYHSHLHYVVGK